MRPSLSIVIPTCNGLPHLPRCLAAVFRHAPDHAQIIVVDDGSTDGTAGWLSRQTRVEVVTRRVNGGYCAAVNDGIAQSRGEVVELLNDDTEVQPGWAAAALQHFADQAVGSVAPLVLRMDAPSIIDSAGQEYLPCGWGRDRGFGRQLGQEFLAARDVLGPSGSSGFYRRKVLTRMGGMTPEFFAYQEDLDLSLRMNRAGYRCVYEPQSRILHARSASYRNQSGTVQRLIARNEELLFWLHLDRRRLAKNLAAHFGFLAVRLLRRLWRGGLGEFLAGKWEAARMTEWIRRRRREMESAPRLPSADAEQMGGWLQALWKGVRWLRKRTA